MPETTAETATVEAPETPTVDAENEAPVEGAEDLGDAGKRALDAMKAERNTAKAELRAAKAEADRLRAEIANKDKPAEEVALDAARAEARTEATQKANVRILKSELKAVATGKLADPTDAHLYIDLTQFDVDDNGDVDSDALKEAVAELLTRKPHLAAGNQPRFEGGGDGGAKAPAKPDDTLDELIAAAQKARNFPLVATLKQQQAAQKG